VQGADVTCEVREARLDGADYKEGLRNLTDVFETTVRCILDSEDHCPNILRQIFAHIRKVSVAKFPDDPDVGYTSVTGFIFLRFFVPAIMTPKLFNLMEDYAIGNSEQTFKLVASLLQKLANLQIFENQEYHMDKLNPILKKEMPRLKKFVDALCDTEKKDTERTASGITKMEYADETPIARLCTIIEKYSSILETGLPDRTVAVFLRELEDLTNEMQFLNKKFKTDQKRTRKEIVAEETEKRLRNSEESPKRKTFTLSPKKNNRASRDQLTVFPEYNPIPPFTKEEVDPKVWAYVESLLQALEHAKSASSSLISSPSQSVNGVWL